MKLRYVVLSLVMILALWACAPQAVHNPPQPLPPSAPPPKSAVKPPPTPPQTLPPRETPPSPSMVASAQWVDEAIHAIEVRNYDRATALLERAISVEPNNGRAFYYYGFAMGERWEKREALNQLRYGESMI